LAEVSSPQAILKLSALPRSAVVNAMTMGSASDVRNVAKHSAEKSFFMRDPP
jgi:hypothetical protein